VRGIRILAAIFQANRTFSTGGAAYAASIATQGIDVRLFLCNGIADCAELANPHALSASITRIRDHFGNIVDKNALFDERSIENFSLYVNLNLAAGYCGVGLACRIDQPRFRWCHSKMELMEA
jgi:hypothetical protein